MELWTAQHVRTVLPALVGMLVLAVILRLVLKKQPWEIRMIPIKILAMIIVLLEIGKQIVSAQGQYDLYSIPLHYCSLFIFMLPAFAFYRGKGYRTVGGVTAGLCAAVLALMLIYPNLIYSAGNIEAYFQDFMSFHTVTFHNIVMLAFILIPALELHEPQPKGESMAVVWFMLGFCVVSSVMAQILKTNYANFYQCNIPVFENIRLSLQNVLGVVVTQILYVSIVSVLTILFTLAFYRLYRLLSKAVKEKEPVAV